MPKLENQLQIKYRLRGEPLENQSNSWAAKTRAYINQGFGLEVAGKMAAHEVFSDFGCIKYAAEADTVEALLEEARPNMQGGIET